MVDGLVALLESDVETPVNIGNPDERTIQELAEVVIDVTESESGITHEPLPPQDPQVRQPDISKARSELNWKSKVALRDGLQQTVSYFNKSI
jgi:dTDP-glucose 4,6-dehydratase